MVTKRWFANLSLLTVTLVWGATFTLTKGALLSVTVFPFLTVRFFIATLVLLLVAFGYRPSRQAFRSPQLWKLGIPLGVLLFLAYAFQTLGLGRTGAAVSGFITGLNVVLVPLLSVPLLKKTPSVRIWMGVTLAVVGLAFLSGAALLSLQPGDLLVLGCTVFLALQILLIDRFGHGVESLALACVELGVVAVGSLIATAFMGPSSLSPLLTFHTWVYPPVMWAVLVNAVLGTSVAYWAQNHFQRYTSAAQIAIIFSMEPVFAAIIAALALGERLSVAGWVGGALIFVSMLIGDETVTWKSVRRFLNVT